MAERTLIVTAKISALLGLLALFFTAELRASILGLAAVAWIFSWVLDRHPTFQEKMRPLDNLAVVAMLVAAGADVFLFRSTVFMALAHFLLMFQTYKLLGRKKVKDCQQILFFTFFQVLSACTLAADMRQAFILMALIPASAVGLFWHEIAKEENHGTRQLDPAEFQNIRRLAWFLGLGSLPVSLILTIAVFTLFPRMNWNMRIPGFGNENIGYAEQLDLTRTGDLQGGETIILWISFASEQEKQDWPGYLRGASFDSFDGHQWKPLKIQAFQTQRPDSNGMLTLRNPGGPSRSEATITLLDSVARTLFTQGIAYQVSTPLSGIDLWTDGSLHYSVPWHRPLTYTVWATEEGETFLTERDRELYLATPPVNERVIQLATEQSGTGTFLDQALQLETYFKTHFEYTLRRGDRVSENPVEDFLFVQKKGSCGRFASAMALMLRLRGIPSRVVAGYFGGEWNEVAKQYVIRHKDAHLWVEAFVGPERGWVRFDPTPRPKESSAGASVARRRWLQIRQTWDYLNLKWNRYVVEYDLQRQINAFGQIQEAPRFIESWFHQQSPMAQQRGLEQLWNPKRIMGCFAFFLLLWMLRKFHQLGTSTPERVYKRFLSKMAARGIPKHGSETGHEFARRASKLRPEIAREIDLATTLYYRARFAPDPSTSLLAKGARSKI